MKNKYDLSPLNEDLKKVEEKLNELNTKFAFGLDLMADIDFGTEGLQDTIFVFINAPTTMANIIAESDNLQDLYRQLNDYFLRTYGLPIANRTMQILTA